MDAHALGARSEAQRRERLFDVCVRGRDAGDDHGLAVAAQALLEQLREHRVTEGHVCVCVPAAAAMRICQRRDDVAQREQAGADAFALGYGEVLGACGVKGGEAGDFGQALGRQRGRSSAFKSGGWPTGLVRARAL